MKMTAEAQAAYEKIQGVLDSALRGLSDADYRDALENVEIDVTGKLEALDEEAGQ